MIPLISHPLILKYFGCQHFDKYHGIANHDFCMAYRILEAMCQPIKKGEKFLVIDGDEVVEQVAFQEYKEHWSALRLPDQFQPRREKECDHGFHYCICSNDDRNCEKCHCHCKKPDPVEERILVIKKNWWTKNTDELDKQLRELVALAREGR